MVVFIESAQTIVGNPLRDHVSDECQFAGNLVGFYDSLAHAPAFEEHRLHTVCEDVAVGNVLGEQLSMLREVRGRFGGQDRSGDDLAGRGEHNLGVIREVNLRGKNVSIPWANKVYKNQKEY